jgi:small-conductance mechanosensitive channel
MIDGFNKLVSVHQINVFDLVSILGVLFSFGVLASFARWAMRRLAEVAEPAARLKILRLIPLVRLGLVLVALALVTPFFMEPSFKNIMALVASAGVLLALVFKDYGSSLAAGLVAVLENPYQVGDWIEIDGAYGEVRRINPRAVHLVTSEDNEVIIPHYQMWSKKISNATSGNRTLLCVADFYLDPNHDGQDVIKLLKQVAESSVYRSPESKVSVVVKEQPWGSHYKIKAYVKESREQFAFITDLTIRGKRSLLQRRFMFALAIPSASLKK